MKKITIIDYGLGNLGSVANMLKKIGADYIISSSIKDIESAEKLILPGVGSFDKGMKVLRETGYYDIIKTKVNEDKTPILGICLGMQLLTKGSEEGNEDGFGFIDAYTEKFQFSDSERKIPHMGWNTINIKDENSLFKGLGKKQRFYFVHSFAIKCNDKNDILSQTSYGIEFVSSFKKDNIYGVQFHPEKSHKFGINLFNNFNKLV